MGAAIIGTGFIAQVHAQALKAMGREIAVVIHPSAEKARAFAETWGAKSWSADSEAFLDVEVVCVLICTPPMLHFGTVQAALEAGKHMICEKPLCISAQEAKTLWQLAERQGVVHAVNFNVRFYEACRKAREEIASGSLGKPLLIHGSYLQAFHALPSPYSWRYQPEKAGKMRAMTEIGSHWIDLARYWTGLEVTAVSADFAGFFPKRYVADGIMQESGNGTEITVGSEDAALLHLRFSNGAAGSVVLSEVSHGRNNRLSLEVTGNLSSLWWNSEDPWRLHHGTSDVSTQINAFSGCFPQTFQDFFAAVYRDIAAGHPAAKPDYPTFYDGYINAAVCEAALESSENQGKWINVEGIK